ncbi:MAG: asparagine synthase-related protein [bacterium]
MPGLHIRHSGSGLPSDDHDSSLLNELCHDDYYSNRVLHCDDHTAVAFTSYPDYPIAIYDDARYWIVLEGKIYNVPGSRWHSDLRHLAHVVFEGGSSGDGKIAGWLLDHDGDYVIVLRDKASGQWVLVNDVLARLPVYCAVSASGLVLSREFLYTARHQDPPRFNRLAIAEQLQFGYALGTKTLLEGVELLAPASVIRWSGSDNLVEKRIVHTFDLGPNESLRPPLDSRRQLVELFETACRQRVDPRRPVIVTLSGGLDARSVLAGLVNTECNPMAMTHHQPLHTPQAEVDAAREVAAALGVDWHLSPLGSPTGGDLKLLLKLKGGLNELTMAYGLPFMRMLREKYPQGVNFFSGDGGDMTFRGLWRGPVARDNGVLADYILTRHQLLSSSIVTHLTGITLDQMRQDLLDRLIGCPEADTVDRFVHYMIFERAIRSPFEGEDRNRAACWCVAPFYSLPVFRLVMNLSDRSKRYHRFHCDFLKLLSPSAASVIESNQGSAPGSFRFRARTRLLDLLAGSPRIYRAIKRYRYRPSLLDHQSPVLTCLARQVSDGSTLANALQGEALKRYLTQPDSLNHDVWHRLLTLTSAVEYLRGLPSSLDEFADEPFD